MSKRVPVTLSDEEHGMLKRLASEMGVSMAGWVRVAVRSAAREAEDAPEPGCGE